MRASVGTRKKGKEKGARCEEDARVRVDTCYSDVVKSELPATHFQLVEPSGTVTVSGLPGFRIEIIEESKWHMAVMVDVVVASDVADGLSNVPCRRSSPNSDLALRTAVKPSSRRIVNSWMSSKLWISWPVGFVSRLLYRIAGSLDRCATSSLRQSGFVHIVVDAHSVSWQGAICATRK